MLKNVRTADIKLFTLIEIGYEHEGAITVCVEDTGLYIDGVVNGAFIILSIPRKKSVDHEHS